LPTDQDFVLNEGWKEGFEACGGAWPRADSPFEPWKPGEVVREAVASTPEHPGVWLANIGLAWANVDHFVNVASAFVLAAGMACKANKEAFASAKRAKPLLALPAVGTRDGGGQDLAGRVLRRLLPELRKAAEDNGVDVALVCIDPGTYAAAQRVRTELDGNAWAELGDQGVALADRLAGHARDGRLVLFLGAGASVGAGLPAWHELLEELRDTTFSDIDKDSFSRLSHLDQATLLDRRIQAGRRAAVTNGAPAPERIADLVRRQFDKSRSSLVHQLLAGLPVDEVVTTNYDKLFEVASKGAGRPVSVLPRDPDPAARRWLLKMHGCIDHLEDIVLTREDYLRYEQHRAALAGIVQALLITKHMLFVGFSLNDDNFHRIVDAVRRALGPQEGQDGKFGTVVFVTDEPLVRELWLEDLQTHSLQTLGSGEIPIGSVGDAAARVAVAARRLEILLDCLGSKTVPPSHLGKAEFDDALTPRELRLRDALAGVLADFRADTDERDAETLRLVQNLAGQLGMSRPAVVATGKGPEVVGRRPCAAT
jgi:hypothetical protein